MKNTKRALLLSALALVMSVAMLIGSTFAWFTDSATSGNNKIVAGTLDVDLLMADTAGNYASIAGVDEAIFGDDILWEPGKTQIVYLAVANNGNLDLKYNIALNVIDGGLIGSLEYAIVDGAKYGDIDTNATSWDALKATENVQTSDVVAGTAVAAPKGAITVAEKTEYFALAVHMKEDADNKYQGKNITIDITVLATQLASESDSFDNQYDVNAEFDTIVYTSADLQSALAAGKNVIVGSNIDLGGTTITVPANVTAFLDLNGKTISSTATKSNASMFMVVNSAKLTIADSVGTGKITYNSNNGSYNGYTVLLEGELVMESGTLEKTGSWNTSYAVDVDANAWNSAYTAPTNFTMNGGKIVCDGSAVRVVSFSSPNYADISSSFIMNGGTIEATGDGVFVQQPDKIWNVLNVTINGGEIKGGRNPIRICIFNTPTSYVNGEKCIKIALDRDATLTYTGNETPNDWIVDGKIRYSCYGGTLDDILNSTTITIDGVVQ